MSKLEFLIRWFIHYLLMSENLNESNNGTYFIDHWEDKIQ